MNADKKANYDVKVEGVDMVPDPVVSGKPATFKISASTGNFIFIPWLFCLCESMYIFLFDLNIVVSVLSSCECNLDADNF